jgi:hypothetical protein
MQDTGTAGKKMATVKVSGPTKIENIYFYHDCHYDDVDNSLCRECRRDCELVHSSYLLVAELLALLNVEMDNSRECRRDCELLIIYTL